MPVTQEPIRDAPRRKLWRGILLAAVGTTVVFAALSVYADVQSLGQELTRFSAPTCALALALVTLNYALRFARWQYYLGLRAVRLPTARSLLIFLAGFIMSVTPGKFGEVIKSALLWESDQVPVPQSAPIVVAERLTDLLALVILIAIGSLSLGQGWALAGLAAAVVLSVLALLSMRRLASTILGFAGRLPFVRNHVTSLEQAYDSLSSLITPRALAIATSLAVLGWGAEGLALGVLIRESLGSSPAWLDAIFAYAAPTVAGAVSMLPGGLGVTEAGMAALLHKSLGLSTAAAGAVTILIRLLTLWWGVAVGCVALALFRHKNRRPAPTQGQER